MATNMRGNGGRLGMKSDEDKCLVSRGMRPAAVTNGG